MTEIIEDGLAKQNLQSKYVFTSGPNVSCQLQVTNNDNVSICIVQLKKSSDAKMLFLQFLINTKFSIY